MTKNVLQTSQSVGLAKTKNINNKLKTNHLCYLSGLSLIILYRVFISKNKRAYHLIKISFKAEACFVPYCSTI